MHPAKQVDIWPARLHAADQGETYAGPDAWKVTSASPSLVRQPPSKFANGPRTSERALHAY